MSVIIWPDFEYITDDIDAISAAAMGLPSLMAYDQWYDKDIERPIVVRASLNHWFSCIFLTRKKTKILDRYREEKNSFIFLTA